LITTLGVFGFDPESRGATLQSYHPGVEIAEIERETEWPLKVADDVHPTAEPTREELAVIRAYDREGYWTKSQV